MPTTVSALVRHLPTGAAKSLGGREPGSEPFVIASADKQIFVTVLLVCTHANYRVCTGQASAARCDAALEGLLPMRISLSIKSMREVAAEHLCTSASHVGMLMLESHPLSLVWESGPLLFDIGNLMCKPTAPPPPRNKHA